MTNPNQNERSRLFHDIGVIDFVIVEMNEYLDTYAMKYGPLRISDADGCNQNEWKWATQPWPWEGGC